MTEAAHDETARALLGHDRWANRLVLDRCADLSHDDFHRDFDIGVGSLHEQMVHIAIVLGIWTDVLEGRPMRADPEDLPWDVERLRRELGSAHDGFDASVHALPLTDTVVRPYRGEDIEMTRATVLAHVTTHNAHHRAQCLHMLKRLGMSEPLPSSAVSWHIASRND